jgi:hypothetical protein
MILWVVTLCLLSHYRLSRYERAATLAEISRRQGNEGPTS